MTNILPEHISEEQLNELLPMWKTQETVQRKVSQISKGARILAEWIGFIVELKLKQETLAASKKKIPDLEGKIRIQMTAITETDSKMQIVQEKVAELKEKLQKSIKIEEERINSSDMSIISIKSTHMKVESPSHVLFSPHFYQKDDFPNFGSTQLYGDIFVSRFGDENEMEIKYEGENELIGCCRTRFFCF